MGRAERRQNERKNRILERKSKVLVSYDELERLKRKVSDDVSIDNCNALLTCFALAGHRLYGHGHKRTMRSLRYIDELMGQLASGEATLDDFKSELEREIGVIIAVDP